MPTRAAGDARTATDRTAEAGSRRRGRRAARNRRAAWTLVLLTPVVSELALGSTPVRMAWLVLFWMPVYGAGVLLIREVVTRRGRGWPSLLLLGLAYELVEDGIGLQALTSPHLYHAARWGARVAGVNLPYWEANALYHAAFTVVIPIALTELLFPGHRGRPYLGRTGTVVAAVVAVLGVGVLRGSVPPSQDPGYQVPPAFVVGCVLAVIGLGVVALVLAPPRRARAGAAVLPSRPVLGVAAALAVLTLMALTFPLPGARQPAYTHGSTVLVPMAATAVIAAACCRFLARAAAGRDWTPRHTLAVIAGALVAHSLAGLVTVAHTVVDRIGLLVIVALTLLGVAWLDRLLRNGSDGGSTAGPDPWPLDREASSQKGTP